MISWFLKKFAFHKRNSCRYGEEEEEDSMERTRQELERKIADLNGAIDNFTTEADRGLSDKISQLSKDMEGMQASVSDEGAGGGAKADGTGPTPKAV